MTKEKEIRYLKRIEEIFGLFDKSDRCLISSTKISDGHQYDIKETGIFDKLLGLLQQQREELVQDAKDHWNNSEGEELEKFWRDVLVWLKSLELRDYLNEND